MTTFKEFVQLKALEDHLPFKIDFDIKPDFSDAVVTKVAGFDIPKFNELLSRETWFFECLASVNSSKLNEVNNLLRQLSIQLKAACNLSLADAYSSLFTPTEELSNSEAYAEFILNNMDKLDRLRELSDLVQNDLSLTWLKISFFMLSRYDGNWTMASTANLRTSQINALSAFINLEANGGSIPEAVETVEDETEEAGKNQ